MLRQAVVTVLVVVLALAAYHVGVRSSPPSGAVRTEDVARLERRIEALEARRDANTGPGLAGTADGEAAPHAPRGGVPAAPSASAPTAAVPRPLTPEEAETQRRQEAVAHFRAQVRAAGPTLTEAAVEEAADLLAAHAEALRLLHMEMTDATPAVRADLQRREERLRQELDEALARVVPPDVVQAVARRPGRR